MSEGRAGGLDHRTFHVMAASGTKTQEQAAAVEPQQDEKVFNFDSPTAKGDVRCVREEYGLRIECDGKPLLFIDLYYRSEDGRKDAPPTRRDRVHVQIEYPLPGEEPEYDEAWLHLYMGTAGIVLSRENSTQAYLNMDVPTNSDDVVMVGELAES